MTGLVAVINYEDFYSKPHPSDPLAFVRDYPTDVLLMVLCRVNATSFMRKVKPMDANAEYSRRCLIVSTRIETY
jgi:hypothetical protein